MSLFVGHIVRMLETADGPKAIVSVRGAGRVVILDAVPQARRGDAVLVEAGVALAIVRGDGLLDPVGLERPRGDVDRGSAGQADTPCV